MGRTIEAILTGLAVAIVIATLLFFFTKRENQQNECTPCDQGDVP